MLRPDFFNNLYGSGVLQEKTYKEEFKEDYNSDDEFEDYIKQRIGQNYQKYGNSEAFRGSLVELDADFKLSGVGKDEKKKSILDRYTSELYTESLLMNINENPTIDNYNKFIHAQYNTPFAKEKYNDQDALGVATSIMFSKSDESKKLGLDTFYEDLSSTNSLIDGINNEWQSEKDLSNKREIVESMYDRILSASKFAGKIGANKIDLMEAADVYKSVLDGWEDTAYYYSGFKNADEFNASKKNSEALRTADVDALDKELESIEAIGKKVQEYENDIQALKNTRNTMEYRTRGLPANLEKYDIQIDEKSKERDNLLKECGYASYDELIDEYNKKNQFRNNAKRIQEWQKLGSVGDVNSENYDWKYDEYVQFGKKLARFSDYVQKEKYLKMTNDELDNLAYYIAYDEYNGTDMTNQYLDSIEETLNSRIGMEWAKAVEDNIFLQYGTKAVAGLDQFASGIVGNFTDEYTPISASQYASQKIDYDLRDVNIPIWYNFKDGEWESQINGRNLAQIGGDLIQTGANMAPSILASTIVSAFATPVAGQFVGASLMGASARGSARVQMINLGYSKKQADAYANLVGASEAALSYALSGIGKLGGRFSKGFIKNAVSGIDNGLLRFAVKFGGSMASEGLEEGLQEILNPLFMNIAAGYDTGARVNWSEVGYSALLGALSGGIIEGPSIMLNNARVSRISRQIRSRGKINNLLNIALALPDGTTAKKLYNQYKGTKDFVAENMTDEEIASLYEAVCMDAASSYNKAFKDMNKHRGSIDKYKSILEGGKISEAKTEKASKKLESAIYAYTDAQKRMGQYGDVLSQIAQVNGDIISSGMNRAFEKPDKTIKADKAAGGTDGAVNAESSAKAENAANTAIAAGDVSPLEFTIGSVTDKVTSDFSEKVHTSVDKGDVSRIITEALTRSGDTDVPFIISGLSEVFTASMNKQSPSYLALAQGSESPASVLSEFILNGTIPEDVNIKAVSAVGSIFKGIADDTVRRVDSGRKALFGSSVIESTSDNVNTKAENGLKVLHNRQESDIIEKKQENITEKKNDKENVEHVRKEEISDTGNVESGRKLDEEDTGGTRSNTERVSTKIKEILRKSSIKRKNSSFDGGKSGRVEKTETSEMFEATANEDGYRYITLSNGKLGIAFKEAKTEECNENAKTAINILEKLGITAIAFDGELRSNEKGVTEISTEGCTFGSGDYTTVFISSKLDIDGVETAFHEAFHAFKRINDTASKHYKIINIISDGINTNSEAFEKFVSFIADLYSYGTKDVSYKRFSNEIMEEFFAWYIGTIYGAKSEYSEILREYVMCFSDVYAIKHQLDTVFDYEKTTENSRVENSNITVLAHVDVFDILENSDTVYIGSDIITNKKIAIPKTEATVSRLKTTLGDRVVEESRYSSSVVYDETADVVITGNPKVSENSYIFEIDGEYYMCRQDSLNAFANNGNVILASKNSKKPWVVKNGGETVGFLMPLSSENANKAEIDALPFASDVIKNKAEQADTVKSVSHSESIKNEAEKLVNEKPFEDIVEDTKDSMVGSSGKNYEFGNVQAVKNEDSGVEGVVQDTTSDVNTDKKNIQDSQVLENYSEVVDGILSVSDEDAKEYAEKRVVVKVLESTPDVILKNVEDARDLKVIMNYNKLYLAVRENGVFKGHYHALGAEIAKRLPEFLSSPDAIIQLENGRLNLFATVQTSKGNNGIISVELGSTKDIGGKYEDYNVVVTLFSSDDNYVHNLISGEGVSVKYKTENLSQVNPQLYKWLAIINDKSSVDNIISQNGEVVNSQSNAAEENNNDSVETSEEKVIETEGTVKRDAESRSNVIRKKNARLIKDVALRKAKLSSREVKMLEALAKICGRDIRFSESLHGNAKIDLNTGEIIISTDAKNGARWAAVHEVFHALRIDNPAEANRLIRVVCDILEKNKGLFNAVKAKYTEVYLSDILDSDGNFKDNCVDIIKEEIAADMIGYVISHSEALATITGEQRNVLQRFIDRLTSHFSRDDKYLSKLSPELRRAFRDVYKEVDVISEHFKAAIEKQSEVVKEKGVVVDEKTVDIQNEGVKFSKQLDGSGKEYWQVETKKDIFASLSSVKELQNAAYDYILNGEKGERVTDIIDGEELQFRRISAKEFVYGTASKTLGKDTYKQKMRLSPSVIDLIDNANITYDSPDHKNHKMFPDGFKNYQGRVGIDDTIFRYIVRVGKAIDGKVFYDISLEVDDAKVPGAKKHVSHIKSSTSTNHYTQNNENVNTNNVKSSRDLSNAAVEANRKYMNAVNDGDVETAQKMVDEAANDAFLNSKVRDKNGKLIHVYHGTSLGGFTWFDTYALHSKFGLFGNGAYFTEDKSIAEQYTQKGQGTTPQIYDVYLNIMNPVYMDEKADINLWKKSLERADLDYISLSEGMTNEAVFREVVETLANEGFVSYEAEETVRNIFENMGHDGITHIGGGRVNKSDGTKHRVWIAFESEQIKSSEPVTYNDNGKVIPLSKRFNSEKSDIRWSRDLSSYTKKEFEAFGWVRYNDILSAGEYQDFTSKFAAAVSGHVKSHKSKNGELIIPVSDIKDDFVYGIDNALVFAKGTIDKPIISSIIRIYADNETDATLIRGYIYDCERDGIYSETCDLFERYERHDFLVKRARTNAKRIAYTERSKDGRRSGEETAETQRENKIKFSLADDGEYDFGDIIEDKQRKEDSEIKYFIESEDSEYEYEGRYLLSGRRGWNDVQSSGKQSGGIFGRAGTLTERSKEDRKETARQLRDKLLTKTTVVGKNSIELINEKAYTDDMKEIVRYNKNQGVKTVFFIGQGRRSGRPLFRSNGFYVNGVLYLSYDYKGSLNELNRHELIHHFYDTEVCQKIKKIIQYRLGSNKVNEIMNMPKFARYFDLYNGKYSRVFEEVIATILSGQNKGETNTAMLDLIEAFWNGNFHYIDQEFHVLGFSLNGKARKNPLNITKYSIEKVSGTDKLYVKADRQVVEGATPKEWGASVEKYINDSIRQGKDVQLVAADGDILTITADTAGKAKFRNYVTRPDGTSTIMDDAEYRTKLNAESHIDELSATSKRGKKDVPDYKNHAFAKDGFNYRTAYFEDFDGQYYKVTLSVGKNGEINTVYNVGKIKEAPFPLVAQRPGTESTGGHKASTDSISDKLQNVNTEDISFSLADDGEYDFGDILNEHIEKYGAIPKGENPVRNVTVPKKISDTQVVSRFARTMMESGVTPDIAMSEFEKRILDGTMTHMVITNDAARQKAIAEIKHDGFEDSLTKWQGAVEAGNVSKYILVKGMELYNQ